MRIVHVSHNHAGHVPDQDLLVPAAACAPPSGSEQAPVHAHGELGVSAHSSQLPPSSSCAVAVAAVDEVGFESRPGAVAVAAVGPDPAGHVVAGAQERVARVGAPGQFADGVVVAGQDGEGALGGAGSDVEGADLSVDAGGGDDAGAVFVPVVGQGFRGRGGGSRRVSGRMRDVGRGRVQGDGEDEVVGCRGGGAEIEQPEVGVGGDGGEHEGVVRGEGGAVSATVGWKGEDGGRTVRGPLRHRFLAERKGKLKGIGLE